MFDGTNCFPWKKNSKIGIMAPIPILSRIPDKTSSNNKSGNRFGKCLNNVDSNKTIFMIYNYNSFYGLMLDPKT